jgi:hypothetical protein
MVNVATRWSEQRNSPGANTRRRAFEQRTVPGAAIASAGLVRSQQVRRPRGCWRPSGKRRSPLPARSERCPTLSLASFARRLVGKVVTFVQSIQSGKLVNNTDQAVESNLTAILRRMAAYENRTVTWDEMLRSQEKYEASLKLRW